MHFIHENSGFTFSLINNAALPVGIYKSGGFGAESMKVHGFIWDGQMLFGYTYGIKQPFSIHAGIGPGLALGRFWTRLNGQGLENFSLSVWLIQPLGYLHYCQLFHTITISVKKY